MTGAVAALGLLGGAAAFLPGSRLPRRGLGTAAAVAVAALAAVTAMVFLWRAAGSVPLGIPLGQGLHAVWDEVRLGAATAVVLAWGAGVACVLVTGCPVRRTFLCTVPWASAAALCTVFLSDGLPRACVLVLTGALLVAAALPRRITPRAAAGLAASLLPMLAVTLVWVCAQAGGAGSGAMRVACAVAWLHALPLPGLVAGGAARSFVALVPTYTIAAAVAPALLAPGDVSTAGAWLCVLATAAAGLAAAVSNRVDSYAVFAAVALVNQGSAGLFLGQRAGALWWLVSCPLILCALAACLRTTGAYRGDVRFAARVPLPRGARTAVGAALFVVCGGLAPGAMLTGRIGALGVLGGQVSAGGIMGFLVLLGGLGLLVGLLRMLALFEGAPAAVTPRALAWVVGLCALAGAAPFLHSAPPVPGSGWYALFALSPVLGALALTRAMRGEDGVAALWSRTGAGLERGILWLLGPAPWAVLLGAGARVLTAVDGALCVAFQFAWIWLRRMAGLCRLPFVLGAVILLREMLR